jgi:predicted transcriptional regulator
MPTERANDLRAFRDFANEQLANGGANMKLDEALALWEYNNSPEEKREETISAIERGLDDMNAGRTVDAIEFVERMRQRFQAPAKP